MHRTTLNTDKAIKNRESAKRFRTRQKEHVIKLEEQVEQLKNESVTLAQDVVSLKVENQDLVSQRNKLRMQVESLFSKAYPLPPSIEMQPIDQGVPVLSSHFMRIEHSEGLRFFQREQVAMEQSDSSHVSNNLPRKN